MLLRYNLLRPSYDPIRFYRKEDKAAKREGNATQLVLPGLTATATVSPRRGAGWEEKERR